MSPFRRALAGMNAVLDDHLGEPAQCHPRARGDFGHGPDAARPSFAATVLVGEVDPSSAQIESTDTMVAYSELTVEIRRGHLPGTYTLRKGDEIDLVDRRLRLRINRVERDDFDVLRLVCGPLTNASPE